MPLAVVFDPERIADVINGTAAALATQLALSTEWEPDDSISSGVLQLAEDINPISRIYNYFTTGDSRSSVAGAVAVKIDPMRRARLFASFVTDFQDKFERNAVAGPFFAYAYLSELVARADRAIRATNEQFAGARAANSRVSLQLNDALDRCYRISVAASVAFLVVGCLPVAAGGATALMASSAWTGTAMASSGTAGMVMLKVAGVGLVYGTLNSLAFDPESVKRARVSGASLGAGAVAGGTNAGSTFLQTGVETVRMREAQTRLNQAAQDVNNANAQRPIQEAMRAARAQQGPIPPGPGAPSVPRYIPGGMNEVQRELLKRREERIAAEVAKKYRIVSRTGSGIFIGVGLYLMRGEIKDAWDGLTTGTDRTR
ncbi:hypothetical protein [Tropicimonas sp. IMCC6043]|uniref:hypothetical protein n=1 Tax=Tropicimonas sp. IMCC6043 TaxID=2510645 RepID=UPI00101DF532|nr:hypothetical protein [Tropicimonas sp. IMCC6043]RYH08884.1 hypothetical protein EU800_14200 [Tropicimonas sp. IMCC6043]